MTHSIVLEVPENIYLPLAEEAEAKGRKVEEIALEMLDLLTSDRKLDDDEFERLSDLLADEFEKRLPKDFKPLSDYAMSREGIYEDHL
ncbi:hypothetical protein BH20ACI4_BH20ACI4_23320 [soil metagenome]